MIRKILRIEKVASRMSWYETLTCGHKGQLAEGPHLSAMPERRASTQVRTVSILCVRRLHNEARISGTRNHDAGR